MKKKYLIPAAAAALLAANAFGGKTVTSQEKNTSKICQPLIGMETISESCRNNKRNL